MTRTLLEETEKDGIKIRKLRIEKDEFGESFSRYLTSPAHILGWDEEEGMEPFPSCFGEFQWQYEKNGILLSLMEVKGLEWDWEIYCLEGGLHLGETGIEKFNTKEEAISRILEILK